MYNLFKTHIRGILTLLLLLTFAFISTTASASSHYRLYKPGEKGYGYFHYDFIAIVPEKIEAPKMYSADFYYPANDLKPDNKNYQLIRHYSLGLINAQMNI